MLSLIFQSVASLVLIIYLIFIVFDMLDFIITKVPPLPTSSSVIPFLLKEIENHQKKVFIDLGCGNGKVLLAIKKRYPETQVIGYEKWPSQFLMAKAKNLFAKTKARIFYKDLFLADLKNADIIFCFLMPFFMPRLGKKLKEELKSGALIICNSFSLENDWQPIKIIHTGKNPRSTFGSLFIYKKD